MKLHDEKLQWIYDNLEYFKRALVTLDFCKEQRMLSHDDRAFHRADDIVHSLALSFLMVAMGEHIPKEMWTVDDFSVLYGILDNARDNDDVNLRDFA